MAEPGTHKPEQLKGIVEADETFFRESFKGKRHGMTRPTHKRGTPASKRGLSAEQIPVWSAVTDLAVRLTMRLKKMMPDTSVLH